jgi:hypothetical protein
MQLSSRFVLLPLLGALALSTAFEIRAESYSAPYNGYLYVQCIGGSAGASSQFGSGSSPANFKALLTGLPSSCPGAEVPIGAVTAGQTVEFGISTVWNGQTFWAFSGGSDQASLVAFTDGCNNLGMGGKVTQQTSFVLGKVAVSTWVMHLNDAAHYTVGQCEANNILVQLRLEGIPTVQQMPPRSAVAENQRNGPLTVRAITHASRLNEHTSAYTTPGTSNTNCSGTGTTTGNTTNATANCQTTSNPAQTHQLTMRTLDVVNVVQAGGMQYTISCTAHWRGSNCGPMIDGDTFPAEIDGNTMWITARKGGNQGKEVRSRYRILDIRPLTQQ